MPNPSHILLLRASITAEGCYFLVAFALVMAGALVREVNLLLLLAGMSCGAIAA